MEAMASFVVLWNRPYHLSGEEAAAWTQQEASRLLSAGGVARAELRRLEGVSERHAQAWNWMLELHLSPRVEPSQYVAAASFAEWLANLRVLGLRPAVLLADPGIPVPAETH
jgi:hypothetical protein